MLTSWMWLGGLVLSGLGGQDELVLGSVRVDESGEGTARVSWRTDRPSVATLDWGRRGESVADGRVVLSTGGTEHEVLLEGLAPDTEYLFLLEGEPEDGGESVEVAGGFRTAGFEETVGFDVGGKLEPWLPITLSFEGPEASETGVSPNPFLDYRLNVDLFGPDGERLRVPGYFDGDGEGGGSGNVWRVRFPVHLPGQWTFQASFRSGPDVAVSLDPKAGVASHFDRLRGSFFVSPTSTPPEGFYEHGKLLYVNDHYLRFVDGTWYVKAGSNSPENLLGYAGFDNTVDHGGIDVSGLVNGLHRFPQHVADFGPGGLGSSRDPYFVSADTGVDSRGIIGALNYLSAMEINSLFFLPMNLGGDGWDTCPFVGYGNNPFDKTHYDLSKLAQWNEVFEHAARRGILLQFVLGETENGNEAWLDQGELGVQRKLFYREMIARFGHLPAIHWNLCEESDWSGAAMAQFAGFIQDVDPYDHPIGFHSNVLPVDSEYPQWDATVGDSRLSTNSIQAIPWTAGAAVEKWREDSAAAGRPWVVGFDEQLQGLTDDNATELRKLMLYDVLFSGGGVEWYAGYHELPLGGDLRMEDFREREEMWRYTAHARGVLESLPFWWMEPADELVSGETSVLGGAEVFALPGYAYAIYLPDTTETGRLDLTGIRARLRLRWYDPRTGRYEGVTRSVFGGRQVDLGAPPFAAGEDWVVVVTR